MSESEFSLYVDALFLGHLACSVCGVEFGTGQSHEQADADLATRMARTAIDQGWRIGRGRNALCPQCAATSSMPAAGGLQT